MNNRKPPVNAQVMPIAGRQLPADWQKQAAVNAKLYDEELKNQLENAWKKPKWSNKLNGNVQNITRGAMLSGRQKPEDQQ